LKEEDSWTVPVRAERDGLRRDATAAALGAR
jgi:hypothetical protein